MSRLNRRSVRFANIIAAISVATPLLFAFRLWSFAYFWIDDFGNIFWVRSQTSMNMIGYIADPFSTFFRPMGMLFYEVLYHAVELNPLPYHVVAWGLHAINTGLLFLVLRRLLRSPFAAAAGAIPFAFRVNFADIYWSFGTIFELLACGLMLIGIYLYISCRPSWKLMAGLTVIYVLAIKSKEMAITLLAIWVLYDCCIRRRIVLTHLALPLIAAIWFTRLRVQTMRGTNPLDPYYMDLRWSTVMAGFGQYFNWLYGIKLPALLWCVLLVTALGFAIYRRNGLATFFLSSTIVAFAPVIFLVNHRWPYFWYIPFFGISGLFGLGAKYFSASVSWRVSLPTLVRVHIFALLLWSAVDSGLEYARSSRTRITEAEIAHDFRSFVEGMQSLPQPEPGATLYFRELPPHFNSDVLNSAVQVVLKRPDVHAVVVANFPPEATWRLTFSGGLLRR
jgi:hypothetical protein